MKQIENILNNYRQAVANCQKIADLLVIKADCLGKNGKLNSILKDLKNLTAENKKQLGSLANVAKEEAIKLFDERLAQLERAETLQKLAKNRLDISLTNEVLATGLKGGGLHPLTQISREVEDIFLKMGFDILDGPYIEDEYHNFSALNIPAEHPARDMQDTFWFNDMVHLLRTQTSPIQIRGMEQKKPPFKFLAPGKVFRNEDVDASHEMAFHQIEAMVVGRDIGVPAMLYCLQTTLSKVFARPVDVRLRTGFFPFVEPGFELDISCQICGGKGCTVCKQSGWIEFCGCGLIHPNVLKAGGIDSNEFSGFAFGMGLDRLAMMLYGIDDIRLFHSGDLRFISQFG
ncbi:MAG: phenylalanine--tRNA ligase subunit alpha [Spirochaetaceae bacterium]|nr:phenylalanine--tRNA ligase subunit alpha [Spirochaetaceae bacterium]